MAAAELQWTVPGQSHADVVLNYDPSTVNSDGYAQVTSASGTYQTLNSSGNVVDTDQVTGLYPTAGVILTADDLLNITGQNVAVDTAGIGLSINNAADADNIGPGDTPEVTFTTDIFGDYRESKGDAVDVSLQAAGSTPPTGGGGSGSGSGSGSGGGGSGSGGTTSSGGVTVTQEPNGHTLFKINAPDQTVTSNYFDTFQNGGNPETTFVFEPGYGRDVVSLFRVNGVDHDTLSFLGSDFNNSIADVLQHTHDVKGGVLITDPTPSSPGPGGNDTLLLKGITKHELMQNRRDFTFHT